MRFSSRLKTQVENGQKTGSARFCKNRIRCILLTAKLKQRCGMVCALGINRIVTRTVEKNPIPTEGTEFNQKISETSVRIGYVRFLP